MSTPNQQDKPALTAEEFLKQKEIVGSTMWFDQDKYYNIRANTLEEYASQQTAPLLKEIEELKERWRDTCKRSVEKTENISDLKWSNTRRENYLSKLEAQLVEKEEDVNKWMQDYSDLQKRNIELNELANARSNVIEALQKTVTDLEDKLKAKEVMWEKDCVSFYKWVDKNFFERNTVFFSSDGHAYYELERYNETDEPYYTLEDLLTQYQQQK